MRVVNYTLPALQPSAPAEGGDVSSEGKASFRELVRGEPLALPATMEQQLRLDVRPFTGTYIGPPPRPRTLDVQDAETQRLRWHAMLLKHSPSPGAASSGGAAGGQPVANMLEMLQEMQYLEDSIVSQTVSLTRG